MRLNAAILVALFALTAVFGQEGTTRSFEAGKVSGNTFEDDKPRGGPKECYFSVSSSGQEREITISTDEPTRAKREAVFVAGVSGARYKAISFRVPSELPTAFGGEAPADETGYVVRFLEEKKANRVALGGTTRLEVKFTGESDDILKDGAEVVLTRDFVPVYVRVDSLTKTPKLNKSSKITCEQFTEIEVEEVETASTGRDSETPQGYFFDRLKGLCGQAYAHVQDPPVPSEPILDLRKCDDEEVLLGVHFRTGGELDRWDRSQTWAISRSETGLKMKYTRRISSRPDADQSGWTAETQGMGTADLQVFHPDAGTLEATPDLERFGWLIRLQAGADGKETLLYQAVEKTDEGEVSRGGYLFDISSPIDPPDRLPWGVMEETSDEEATEQADDIPAEAPPKEPAADPGS